MNSKINDTYYDKLITHEVVSLSKMMDTFIANLPAGAAIDFLLEMEDEIAARLDEQRSEFHKVQP